MKHFEEMASGVTSRALIKLDQIEILVAGVPHSWTRALEDERILKISLCGHHAVHSSVLDTPLHVSDAADIAVGEDRNLHTVLDLFYDFPVCNAGHRPFHVSRSSVNG
jgi:hypothetical protein